MEQNENQNIASQLCRMGCGFFGNQQFEGMCSKCYKDHVKRKNQTQSSTSSVSSGRHSPVSSSVSSSSVTLSQAKAIVSAASTMATTSVPTTTPSVDTATPTVPSVNLSASTKDKDSSSEEGATGGAEVKTPIKNSEPDTSSDERDGKRPTKIKNRCTSCKKKVGLTGFPCRCGGLFCSLHRYSDKHDCQFNYKELAQEEIRKNNPVVVGQKIMKI
ncbi:unnamed protein product [Owenia fusiformis]|uniref:Uncharacterized protein n=1 Tax=Owenia fusiformis TaxID=6347 RepID=A0A8J1XS72_OWEFU|nr:unnamed protein product [Owenia fusiformis]